MTTHFPVRASDGVLINLSCIPEIALEGLCTVQIEHSRSVPVLYAIKLKKITAIPLIDR